MSVENNVQSEVKLIVDKGKRTTIFEKRNWRTSSPIYLINVVLPHFLQNTGQTKKKKLEVQCMSLNWFIGQKSSVTYLSESTKNCVMCFCFLFMQSYKIMQVNDVT